MKINLSPIRADWEPLVVSKSGEVLTVNGEDYDFSVIPEGATLPGGCIESKYFTGDIHRDNGEIELTLVLPHGPNPPAEVAFPQQIATDTDGPVAIPTMPEPEPEEPVEEPASE